MKIEQASRNIFTHIYIMYLYMLPGIALQLFSVINNWNQKLSYINFFGVLIVWNYEASYCICKRPYIFECVKSQPTFQCWINIVTTWGIIIEMTLMRRWKWNKIRCWIFNVETTLEQHCAMLIHLGFQMLHNKCSFNVGMILFQSYFTVASTSAKAISIPI